MKKLILHLMMAIVLILALNGGGQVKAEVEKPNITVLKFGGRLSESYRQALSDRILTEAIQSNRFNVIDRQHLNQVLQEQKLSASGLVQANTGAQMGEVLGLDKLIVGEITNYNSEYHSAEYENGEKVQDAYYAVNMEATIKLLDVETAQYEVATTRKSSATGGSESAAADKAISNLADSIYHVFENNFKIEAEVVSIKNKVVITLNRGTKVGVKEGMDFNIYNRKGVTGKQVATARVYKAESDLAKARVFGDFKQIKRGYVAVETKEEVKLEATIIKRGWRQVTLNMGRRMGIYSGQLYKVKSDDSSEQIIDPVTGEKLGAETNNKGLIYITKAHENYAQGKIVNGAIAIKQGMVVTEVQSAGVELSSVHGFIYNQPVLFKVNTYQEDEYDNWEQISSKQESLAAQVVGLSYSQYLISSNFNTNCSVMWVNASVPEADQSNYDQARHKLNTLLVSASADYYLPIVPGRFYVYPGAGLGLGYKSQPALPDHDSDSVSSFGIMGLAKAGARLKLGKVSAFTEVNYNLFSYTNWSYVTEGEDSPSASDSQVPYPEIKFDPTPVVKFGIGFSF